VKPPSLWWIYVRFVPIAIDVEIFTEDTSISEMSLSDIVDNTRTDKNTVHSYLGLYETLLRPRKERATSVLEVGIAHGGGSIKLWHDYFQNATVYGLDVIPIHEVSNDLKALERVKIHASTNAYDVNGIAREFVDRGILFDMVIDDGPHTLDSMRTFLTHYSHLLKEDGILIIEDIQRWDWVERLEEHVPQHLKGQIEVYDLRKIKGRYDDIVLVIDKSLPKSEFIPHYVPL
jgi:SAM-dependent methyltransferase